MAKRRSSEDLGWEEELGRRHSRRAHEAECRSCGVRVVAGLDADALAFPAQADPAPISQDFEQECMFDDRPTYDFAAGVLTRRSFSLFNYWSPRRVVLAQHRCESPVPHRGIAKEKESE